MAEFKISSLVIALLIFSGVITGMSLFYADLNDNYGTTARDLSTLNVSRDILELGEEAKGAMTEDINVGIPIVSDVINFFYKSIVGVWTGINIMMGSATLVQNTIYETATIMGLPGWAFSIIWTAVILVIVFAFATVILKKEV